MPRTISRQSERSAAIWTGFDHARAHARQCHCGHAIPLYVDLRDLHDPVACPRPSTAPFRPATHMDSVGTGPDYTFHLVELVDSDLRRMSGLVRQYADPPARRHGRLGGRHLRAARDRHRRDGEPPGLRRRPAAPHSRVDHRPGTQLTFRPDSARAGIRSQAIVHRAGKSRVQPD
jgi:hypothetical protein